MSQLTLADVIKISTAHLEKPIVSVETLKKITNFSKLLPATSAIGFEHRLAQDNTEVDFFIRAGKKDGGDKIFAAYNAQTSPHPQLYHSPLWGRIKQFCHIWLQEDYPLNQYIEHIWLEMDNQELDREQPAPCFFFEVSHQANKNYDWITKLALPTLYGQSVPETTKNQIAHCISNLPKYSHIAYIGTMLSRPNSPIRLCIKMEIKDVISYLKAIGWNYDFEQITKTLNNLIKDFAESVVLTLDVQDKVMPRVGFEYKPAFQAKGWDVILARLVENELCYASEREAFLNWQHEPTELQDKEFRHQLTLIPPDKLSEDNLPITIRRLNHVKVDCYQNSQLRAKIYYGLIYLYQQPRLKIYRETKNEMGERK